MAHRSAWQYGLLTLLLLTRTGTLTAQLVTERTPNLDVGWTVPSGIVQFNFLHRFEVSAPPARKVTSFPNFHLATGAPYRFNVGLDYATNSTVFAGIPNEYQLSLRRPILSQVQGASMDLSLTAGYNFAPQSVDAEASVARRLGQIRLIGTVRGMSNGYDAQRSLWGAGGGVVVRLTSWLSLAGDVFSLVNPRDTALDVPAWGAGAQLRIPYSPHSFSIQFTNTRSGSIEGSSLGVRGAHMAGFEFTIPFTLARYFGHRKKPESAPDSSITTAGVTVIRIENLSFGPREIRVHPGARVRWVNGDQLQHSATAENGAFDSGLLDPGRAFEHVFDRAGTFTYHCTPHPFMTGRVIVEP
jgi:plastocyanin